MRLQGSVAVVTGASSGIGRATAADLCAAGATVVAVARREALLRQLAADLRADGGDADHAICDVRDPASVAQTAAAVLGRHGRIDVLVNNAGVGLHRSFLDSSLADIEDVTRANYLGAVHWMKAALPGMVERARGAVVNVGSVAGAMPYVWEASYSASKAALLALTEACAHEMALHGVHVAWVNPGAVRTDIYSEEALRHLPRTAERTWLDAARVSETILDVITRERAGATVPRSLAAAALVRSLAPGLFRRGMRRVYRSSLRGDHPDRLDGPDAGG